MESGSAWKRWWSALRGMEHNPVFRAWRLSHGRQAKRKWWCHPAALPALLFLLTVISVWVLTGFRPAPAMFSGNVPPLFSMLVIQLPAISLIWVAPVIFAASRDAFILLRLPATGSGWHGILSQLADSPVSDEEVLVAAVRINWPRLILAACGAALMFWLLMLILAWPVSDAHWLYYSEGDLFNLIAMQGAGLVLLTAVIGALGGLVVILLSICFGRGLRGEAWAATGAAVVTVGSGVIAVASLSADWVPQGYSLALDRITYEVLLLSGILCLLLWAAGRIPVWRRWLCVTWPVVLTVLVFTGSAWLNRRALPLGNLLNPNDGELLTQTLWVSSLYGVFSPGVHPAALEPNFRLGVVQLMVPEMDDPALWVGYLLILGSQLLLAVILAHFALDAIRRWRRGEE